jgi:PAS domain S-box-containing protein
MKTTRLSPLAFRLLASAVAMALIAGATWMSARRADQHLRADLLLQARLVANAIDPHQMASLTGTEADLASPGYQRLMEQLAAIRLTDPKFHYIYLMGCKPEGSVFFLVDIQPGDEKSPPTQPGEIYPDASAELRNAFVTANAFIEGPLPDAWGIWVSALVPMTDPATGSVIAVLGMDIDARDWKWIVAARAALPIALTALAVLFALLAATLYRSRRDLRAQQEELMESEKRFSQLAEQNRTFIWEVDAQGLYTFVSPVSALVLGYRPDELMGKMHFYDLHPAEGRAAFKQAALAVFQNKEPFTGLVNAAQTKAGQMVWLSTYGIPLLNHDGTLRGYRGTDTDITERKLAEASRFASEKKLSTLFESTSEMTVLHELVFDEQGQAVNYRLTDCNLAFTRITGIQKENAIGKLATEVYRTETAPYLEEYARVGITGNPLRFETFFAPMDKYFMISAVALGDNIFATIATEITERKRSEEQIRVLLEESNQARLALLGIIEDAAQAQAEKAKLEVDLHQAQKMESVGRLAGGVAHDFNNMLGVILGRAEMALDLVDPAQPAHADLAEIREAAQRAADITRQLLTFARKQPIAPKVLDLNQAVEGTLQMLQRLIGENIALHWKRKAHLWPVKVDPSQIDQILVNLGVNARDAIAGVGQIAIEAGNATFDADYCADHAGFAPGEFAWLAISDNGCGMDRETLDHIFEPFFTTKGLGGGTGLGLATVYGIVQQNNGFIHAYSEPGQGTLFKIYLPRHVVDQAVPAEKAVPEVPPARGHETLLLVEDDPSILGMTKNMIERQGYTVWTANTPDEAIRRAKECIGEIHLLITDVVMPEMNGRELSRQLLALHPKLKLLFMSGYTADIIAHNGVLEDGVNFIQKPFSRQDLSAKIREVLDA